MNNLNIKSIAFLAILVFTTSIFAQEARVKIDQPKAIEKLLEFKKDSRTVETYRIQIYSGDSSFRAEKVKSEFRDKYPEWPTEILFQTPNYKIWVGNFSNRLEADRAILRIRENFIKALVLKPKKD